MNETKKLLGLAIVVVSVHALGACKPAEGPAERAGKKVDQTTEDAKQTVKKATDGK